jgi:hypothetical protein
LIRLPPRLAERVTVLAGAERDARGIRPELVLGLTLVASILLGPAIVERVRWSRVTQGLLVRDLAVTESDADRRSCQDPRCTFATAIPQPAPALALRGRLELPPVRRFALPRTFAFRELEQAASAQSWIAITHSERPLHVEWVMRFSAPTNLARTAVVTVGSPGIVTRLSSADDAAPGVTLGGLVLAERSGADTLATFSERATAEPVEAFEFQPIPDRIAVRVGGTGLAGLAVGDPIVMNLGVGEDGTRPIEASGIVEKVDDAHGGAARVEFSIRPDDRHWLRSWVGKATRVSVPPLPDVADLAVTRRFGHPSGDAIRVPASAVVGRGAIRPRGDAEATVWAVVDRFAVPVHVRVVADEDGSAIVGEVVHANSGPVRHEDWARLTSWQRRTVLARATPAGGALLLGKDARIVTNPGAGLAPGEPVRTQ